jgi:hypothetical protein
MGRVIGLLVAVVALWTALEVYTEGLGGAFGGAFAAFAPAEPGAAQAAATPRSVVRRAGDSVDRSFRESEHRYDGQLGE